MKERFSCCAARRVDGPHTYRDLYGNLRCRPCHRRYNRLSQQKARDRFKNTYGALSAA